MKTLLSFAFLLFSLSTFAQKSENIIKSDKPITWLGLDLSHARFIGDANQYKDLGNITGIEVRDKYAPGWNQLFVNEQKKYDVAKYVHRDAVEYAMDVTERVNNSIGKSFFSNDPNEYSRLTEADIKSAVKKYDFKGKKGIGLVIIIEGMSKGKEEATGWITFLDMGTKTVLQTRKVTGKAGGLASAIIGQRPSSTS
ncbi:MAG: hypothetical protein ABI169_15550 [Chitinophagaceae bacterium]